jgi:hypothetical protein
VASQENSQGGTVMREQPVHYSNLALVDPVSKCVMSKLLVAVWFARSCYFSNTSFILALPAGYFFLGYTPVCFRTMPRVVK